jgi:DNA invertase Pin-like site-specific DNA recombinase
MAAIPTEPEPQPESSEPDNGFPAQSGAIHFRVSSEDHAPAGHAEALFSRLLQGRKRRLSAQRDKVRCEGYRGDEQQRASYDEVDSDAYWRRQCVRRVVARAGTPSRAVRANVVDLCDTREKQCDSRPRRGEDADLHTSGGQGGLPGETGYTHAFDRGNQEPSEGCSTAALYLRVSTEEQDLAGQERDLRTEADRRGWTVVKVYAEKVTGTGRVERDEYARLLEDARRQDRPFDRVLVWSLDRWSRAEKFTEAVEAIWALEALGVSFHSLKEPALDTPENPSLDLGREVLRAILPVLSSFESRRKSERVRLAMRELREGRRKTRSGRPVGRPRRVTEEVAARVSEFRRTGLPWKDVARRVGLPAETCRKADWLLKRGRRAVDNSPPSQTVRSTPEEPSR